VESMALDPAFWDARKVFVTGHTGFKGSWLCLWLSTLGARIAGYSLSPPTTPNLFVAARVAAGIASVDGDVRDSASLRGSMQQHAPEIVFHLAAQSLVREGYEHPVDTYSANVLGTVHVLEAVRSCEPVRAVIVVTSDKCYEKREWLWGHRENEPLGGNDPYSTSKACAELVTAAYRNSFFRGDTDRRVAVASVRAGNVIGGGDWARDRLIPDMISAFSQKRPARLRYPDATRPWQHVLDPLHGYLMLAERLCSDEEGWAEAWNFGPSSDQGVSVGGIADRLSALWGGGASWRQDTSVQPEEAGALQLDSTKANRRLGWQPRLDLDSALRWTVEWYRAYFTGSDARATTLDQIARYREGLAQ
jgi:CDP-glucose 4,6-dehydratase